MQMIPGTYPGASHEPDHVPLFHLRTIPDEKVFRIEINEKNGGRHVLFDLENSDIVNVEDI